MVPPTGLSLALHCLHTPSPTLQGTEFQSEGLGASHKAAGQQGKEQQEGPTVPSRATPPCHALLATRPGATRPQPHTAMSSVSNSNA